MPSSWILARATKKDGRNQGRPRYRVLYRLGGRESRARYAGSFTTKAQALARKRWVDGELAALRVPDIAILTAEPVRAPSIREACDEWRASRVDVTEATQVLHRVALARVIPVLGAMCVDEVGEIDVQRLVTELAGKGKKRETIRKSVKYLAAVLDEHGCDPNTGQEPPCASTARRAGGNANGVPPVLARDVGRSSPKRHLSTGANRSRHVRFGLLRQNLRTLGDPLRDGGDVLLRLGAAAGWPPRRGRGIVKVVMRPHRPR